MVSASGIRNVVGIFGNIFSFLLFASPAPTIWKIWKRKSVEEFQPYPYLAGVLNCVFWVFYSLPFVTQHNFLITTVNTVGLLLELLYVAVFFLFGDKKCRLKVIGTLIAEAVIIAAVAVGVLTTQHTLAKRAFIIGILAIVFSLCMYFSPLMIAYKVIKTKSVEYMPLTLSLASFVNGLVWAAYANIGQHDLNVTIPNGVGAIFGLIQLILYACYYKSTPRDEKKKQPELQLPRSTNV